MATEKEKMLAGELYDAEDPELVVDRREARTLAAAYNRTGPDEWDRRGDLLADLFASVGEDVAVEPPIHCDYGYNVHVGDRCYANVGCVLLDVRTIEVGDRCLIGPGVHVYTATHPLDADERAAGLEYAEPVAIGDDVWIGGQAVLTPGVSVGDRAVVGAGAVVTDDVPADVVVAGNPARVVRRLG